LLRVIVPGQEPEQVAPAATFPFTTHYGLAHAPDGRLLSTKSDVDPNNASNRLHELSVDGRSVRQVTHTPASTS